MSMSLETALLDLQVPSLSREGFHVVDPAACGVGSRRDAFITGVRHTGGETYELIADIDAETAGHFLEPGKVHVPSAVSINILQQAALVLFHEAWRAPHGDELLTNRMTLSFRALARLGEPILVEAGAMASRRRGGRIVQATIQCRLVQRGYTFAEGEITVRSLSARAYERLVRREP